jgi:hypothetical protein
MSDIFRLEQEEKPEAGHTEQWQAAKAENCHQTMMRRAGDERVLHQGGREGGRQGAVVVGAGRLSPSN